LIYQPAPPLAEGPADPFDGPPKGLFSTNEVNIVTSLRARMIRQSHS
jgi:hypothetical protein